MVCHSERSNVVAKSKNLVLILFSACAMALSLTACGDDDSSFASRPDDDSSVESSSSSVIPASSGDLRSSSSTNKKSSSSSAKSSGLLTEDGKHGDFVDERDGQVYRAVKIGNQWWMAQNLNYAYTSVPLVFRGYTSDSTSWCYNDSAEYCTKYGRLYTWAAAMDSAGVWGENGKGCGYGKTCSPTYPVRGICPEGWHLPTQTEWNTLFTAVGGSSVAGTKLKSTFGWYNSGNGTDAFSFSSLPAGYRDDLGDYNYEGISAFFWSSTERSSFDAYYVYLGYDYDIAGLDYYDKYYGFSVRCLKD